MKHKLNQLRKHFELTHIFCHKYSISLICIWLLVLLEPIFNKWSGLPNDYHTMSTGIILFLIANMLNRKSFTSTSATPSQEVLGDDTERKLINQLTQDRFYLLLLLARSYGAASKMIIEKKHPNSDNIILVFQLKNGNLRFSVPENEFPDFLRTKTTTVNTAKINYRKNYRLIEELVEELNQN